VCNCGYMVSSNARGMGIPRQMCDHSQDIAVAMGFKAMQFNFVASSNDVAVALWKKLGFDVVGTLPSAFNHPTLGLVDAFIMYIWLTD
jgi:ribosomal protein S18 acetylase RimI-like enzyme